MNPTLALAALLLAAPQSGDLVAIKVGLAETIADGPLEHAVILVEDGRIVAIGADLPIERGIRVVDRPDWTVMPGFVNCHTRIGMERSEGRGADPQLSSRGELLPRHEVWPELLEAGVTTLGVYPGGSGIPGRSVVIRPRGETVDEMVVRDPGYLQVYLQSNPSAKKLLRDAFEKLDKYDEKVAKEREKWEKAVEKKKKSKSRSSRSRSRSKDDEEDKKEGDEEEKGKEEEEGDKTEEESKDDVPDVFVPPPPDPEVQPFLDLREGRLTALVGIRKAADYLHLLDVVGSRTFPFSLEVELRDDIDLFEVAARLGEAQLTVVVDPEITLQPNSRRERNIPAELARAGARVAFVPQRDTVGSHEQWREDVGVLVAKGLDRQAALAGLTREPARVLGLDAELGTLEKDKAANLVFFDGDPFEPSARVRAVMLEGRFVFGPAGVASPAVAAGREEVSR